MKGKSEQSFSQFQNGLPFGHLRSMKILEFPRSFHFDHFPIKQNDFWLFSSKNSKNPWQLDMVLLIPVFQWLPTFEGPLGDWLATQWADSIEFLKPWNDAVHVEDMTNQRDKFGFKTPKR